MCECPDEVDQLFDWTHAITVTDSQRHPKPNGGSVPYTEPHPVTESHPDWAIDQLC